uniref:Kinetochore associated 1 n=1 Tax=Ornithorhynchus anatinus TaxID=9258 RepID=A0A6I8NYR3_ORNAN
MWNEIELLTSDDTGNGCLSIGSREEHGTALYQVDTLVKISSSEKVSFNPKLRACNSSDGCTVVADQSVTLLDSSCQALRLHLQFGTQVDVVGLCQDGEFLLVGERSGNLHLIHVATKQILLTNALVQKAPDETQSTYRDLIIEKNDEGLYHVFLLTSDGFFCIMDLHLGEIQKAIQKMDLNMAKEGTGDCVLSKWEQDSQKLVTVTSLTDSSMIKGAKKFQLIDNLLFILDTENVLSLWDAYTLTPIWNWPSVHIEEFLLTTEADSPSSVTWQGITSNLKLIALTTPNDKQMRYLMVYSLPTMNLLYSLQVSDVASLVKSGISTDTIYLLEGIYENDKKSSESSVSVLVLRCLTEALPENRLSRLLHKRKFAEAESFAIQFGLDIELVYKVKSNAILERLASSSVAIGGQSTCQELVEEAKENLRKIQDDEFVVNYCMKAQWPTYDTTQEMLNYAKIRVLRAQAKLTTFNGAFGPENFSGISWIEFLKNEDILKDIFFQLGEGNLARAQYLWLRHRADFESRFDETMLEKLLNSIAATIPVQALCLWFKNIVIPFVRRVVPKGQKILAKWLEQGARNLELTDKANWPENGLQMAEVFFTAKNPDDLGLASSWHWIPLKEYQSSEEVCQLKKLVNSLQELIKLVRKYNCRLALSDFEKENATTIVFRMFDKVLAPELIPSTLTKFIRPYMKEHSLQEEKVLLLYIKELLKCCSSQSASLFETAWEAKAMAVIGCLSDTDKSADFLDLQGDEEFRRVIYLLQPLPIDYSSRMLYVIATSASSIGVNQLTFAHRRRALQCLLYSADTETIESVFKKPIEEVKCFLKCITFLAEFETLNIPYTYESFHSSPKEGMIKGLWKNHSHEPMAVRLVAELSLEYKVYDPQLWNGLLQKLLGFNMINYLRNVLAAISSVHSLWQIPYFSKSWQRVILIPLLSASCPPSPTQLQDCCESLVALLECPVSTDFDVTGVAKQFVQLDLPAFALACLLLMPQSEKKEQQIKNFLDLCNPETILQQVDEHMKTGELAGFASQIRSFILTDLINKKQFEMFTKTEYLPLLKFHMANTNKVKEVVDYLAKENCLDGISAVIIENLKQSGKPIPADTSAFEIVKVTETNPLFVLSYRLTD